MVLQPAILGKGVCAGGLPVGCSGKALLLLSGGIDSPVAGWLAMKRGVAISYDTRKNSRLFAETAADVLATNNIKTYLF